MVGSYPYGVDVDFQNADNFFLFVESFDDEEFFSEFVLSHHAIEGVIDFPVCFVMAVGFFEGAVVLLDSADSETQSYPIHLAFFDFDVWE